MSEAPIIIIGTGLAGYTLAREFRKLDDSTPVLMLTKDDGHSYSKPMLSTGCTKGKSADALSMGDSEKMAAQLNVSIRSFTEVSHIDVDNKQIHIDKETLAYDRLVLASGASVNRLSIPGSENENILSINDLMDYRQFRQKLEGKNRILIMGAGLIGCEYANDLLSEHRQVTIVDPSLTALNGLIPDFAGSAVVRGLEQAGINFVLGDFVKEFTDHGSHLVAKLHGGMQLETELIISAIGIKPDISLAKSAGLNCHKGVLTNRFLETSHADIYALGDCAEIDGHVLLFVLPLMTSARALAKTLNGDRTKVSFPAMPVVVKTPACPVVTCPPVKQGGRWRVEQDGIHVNAAYVDSDNEVLGFVLTGDCVQEKQTLLRQVKGIHTP